MNSFQGTAEMATPSGRIGLIEFSDYQLTPEQYMNYVLSTFCGETTMLKAVVQEAAALASLALFIGMIAIWSQVLGSL
jgi:hypothetical protein